MVERVLWTSGWDSTFLIGKLLCESAEDIHPIYIADPGRKSQKIELSTMAAMRARFVERFPDAERRLRPLDIIPLEQITVSPKIIEAQDRLRERYHFGSQQAWFAQYLEDADLRDVHMGLVAGGPNGAHLLETAVDGRIPEDQMSSELGLLFGRTRMPILSLTKTELGARAREMGFYDILEMSWFCHTPDNGQPCGLCHPCVVAIRDGMGWRIPLRNRYKSRIPKSVSRAIRKSRGKLSALRRKLRGSSP
jgi:hypothetical protein